ncbi:HPP family protein [Amycolatopsis anabasis]|uniref:HPP family protein n=1 Tax=Amycolatopsis anabasis TaxID=1840409 RepID=UPI001FE590E3|nr:HPP family protein [Amycolatopsis anabasis]
MSTRGLARLHLNNLQRRYHPKLVAVGYSAINSFLSIALIAVAAMLTHQPLVFPSLGPTAFLLFSTPLVPAASPRNTVLGHLVGIGAGALGLAVTGLLTTPPHLDDVTVPRVGSAAIALGLTCGLMPLLRVSHPPAAATTLIIALGLLRTPHQLVVMFLGVLLITAQGLLINRLAGIDYPLWTPKSAGK